MQDMNDWWKEEEEKDNSDDMTDMSISSVSLSKELPMLPTNYGSCSRYSSQSISSSSHTSNIVTNVANNRLNNNNNNSSINNKIRKNKKNNINDVTQQLQSKKTNNLILQPVSASPSPVPSTTPLTPRKPKKTTTKIFKPGKSSNKPIKPPPISTANKLKKSKSITKEFNNDPNVIYDNNKFIKFNKIYKYKSTQNLIIKKIINSNHNICFKELTIRNKDELKRLFNEYKSLKIFYNKLYNNDNIVQLYFNNNKKKINSNFSNSNSHKFRVRLIMKYHIGEDLDDFLVDEDDGEVGFLYENDFRIIIKQILIQLNILHSSDIIHCDLKPHNIRINEQSDIYNDDHPNYYDVNIIDYGFSEHLNGLKSIQLNCIKGTPGFIAPETIKSKKYSIKSDMFSLGCVAFFLITNHYAVEQNTNLCVTDMLPNRKRIKQLLKRENDRNRDNDSKIDQQTIDFVLSCLWKSPKKRPTAKQALKLQIFK